MKNYFAGELSGRTLVVLTYECNTFISRERQRADVAERELAALREDNNSLAERFESVCAKRDALLEELALAKDTAASWKSSADGLAEEAHEIDKRLTAAEQRNAECIALLRRSTSGEGQDHKTWWNDRALILQAVLKPTESGASE